MKSLRKINKTLARESNKGHCLDKIQSKQEQARQEREAELKTKADAESKLLEQQALEKKKSTRTDILHEWYVKNDTLFGHLYNTKKDMLVFAEITPTAFDNEKKQVVGWYDRKEVALELPAAEKDKFIQKVSKEDFYVILSRLLAA